MKHALKRWERQILGYLRLFGFDPKKWLRSIRQLPWYVSTYLRFRRQRPADERWFRTLTLNPCLHDHRSASGEGKGHYFHQDLLVASRVFAKAPRHHVDVGSRLDGFVAHVAAFRPLTVLDIRRPPDPIANIEFLQADIMGALPETLVSCCDSLSCLHALEHFGLGRYGDPIQWAGYRDGFQNLLRMLEAGGTLYLSVPIGAPRIEFNAHRVFSLTQLLELFGTRLRIERFSYVDDAGRLHRNTDFSGPGIKANFGCTYGCGIFEMTKLDPVGDAAAVDRRTMRAWVHEEIPASSRAHAGFDP